MTVQEAKKQMFGMRDALQLEISRIAKNSELSDQGRVRGMARAVLRFQSEADKMRDRFENNEAEASRLTFKLFGMNQSSNPAEVLAYRDAEDRAALVENEESAAALVNRALERGDTVLARSVAAHAYGKGWGRIVQAWAAKVGESDTLAALNDIPGGELLRTTSNLLFDIVIPPELRRLAPHVDTVEKLRVIAK